MSNSLTDPPLWTAAVRAASRLFGVVAAGMILLSVGVICQMVFVRAVLGQSSIWQTEFVTFSLVADSVLLALIAWKTSAPQLLAGQRHRARVLHIFPVLGRALVV